MGYWRDDGERDWDQRYIARPETSREVVLAGVIRDGRVRYLGLPVSGIDGALYQRCYIWGGDHRGHAVMVHSRGMAELIEGFTGPAQSRSWVGDRTVGTARTGRLIFPPASPASRVVMEEQILARLLADPASAHERLGLMRLGADSFTADARYEIFTAMLAESGNGSGWDMPAVLREIGTRAALLPEAARQKYAGPGGSRTQAYCQRLARTLVTAESADLAIDEISHEDNMAWDVADDADPVALIRRHQTGALGLRLGSVTEPARREPRAAQPNPGLVLQRPDEPGQQGPVPRA